jgi:hypothetical protein
MSTLSAGDSNEMKDFLAEIKADRAAAKDKEKREGWTKYVSLSLVILAVLTAIATQRGGGFTTQTLKYMNMATLYQAEASDQWSFYQAKSIKQNLYETTRDQMQASSNGANGAAARALDAINSRIERYNKEKDDIMAKAKTFEKERDDSRKLADSAANHSKDMGMAISIFQVSIAIGGICLVVKKRPLWFISLALGLYAAFKMAVVLNTPV